MMPSNPFSANEVETSFGGRYVLGAELRVGGQGAVYRAKRVRRPDGSACNDEVALKLHLDAKQDKRVEREIEAMKHLCHPALATLLEEGTITISGKQTRYIAWEFIHGEPLDLRLSRGAVTEKEAIRIARDVTSAIGALWGKHIVHRDIAPKNIMIKPDGSAILIDLGGARHLDTTSITAAGMTFGTPGYFSPEQFRAERALTNASDVFTLAIVLLECLLGHHPTNYDQYQLASSPPSASLLVPGVGRELRETIDQMLQLRAAFRPTADKLHITFQRLAT
jgi:eukaryotic-like serine/threonine-protein kinase